MTVPVRRRGMNRGPRQVVAGSLQVAGALGVGAQGLGRSVAGDQDAVTADGLEAASNSEQAARSIRDTSLAQPASISTHDGPERTKWTLVCVRPHGPRQNRSGAISRATSVITET
jgi:hypothetical protein